MSKSNWGNLFSTIVMIILSFLLIYFALQLAFLENDLNTSYTKIEALQNQNSSTLLNPTFDQVLGFLQADRTDKHAYIKDEYVCSDFAEQLLYNATLAGLNAQNVQLRFRDFKTGHEIVCFNTIDVGLVFVEPQSDRILDLYIGKSMNNKTIISIHISGSGV